jgi:FdhD protein
MAYSETRSIERVALSPPTRVVATDSVVLERALRLEARGTSVVTVMCTPGHDLELAAGLLHAEGITGALSQAQDGVLSVDVPADRFAARSLVSTAACGVCGREVIDDLEARAVPVVSRLVVSAEVISGLPAAARIHQQAFEITGGLHAAALFDASGKLVCVREDVGRHNAVDKVVGWGLGSGVDFSAHLLLLSGRLGFELVQKAVMAGIPIVAAVSAPSSMAIDVAERFGVTACGFVRDQRFNIYSHPARIV